MSTDSAGFFDKFIIEVDVGGHRSTSVRLYTKTYTYNRRITTLTAAAALTIR